MIKDQAIPFLKKHGFVDAAKSLEESSGDINFSSFKDFEECIILMHRCADYESKLGLPKSLVGFIVGDEFDLYADEDYLFAIAYLVSDSLLFLESQDCTERAYSIMYNSFLFETVQILNSFDMSEIVSDQLQDHYMNMDLIDVLEGAGFKQFIKELQWSDPDAYHPYTMTYVGLKYCVGVILSDIEDDFDVTVLLEGLSQNDLKLIENIGKQIIANLKGSNKNYFLNVTRDEFLALSGEEIDFRKQSAVKSLSFVLSRLKAPKDGAIKMQSGVGLFQYDPDLDLANLILGQIASCYNMEGKLNALLAAIKFFNPDAGENLPNSVGEKVARLSSLRRQSESDDLAGEEKSFSPLGKVAASSQIDDYDETEEPKLSPTYNNDLFNEMDKFFNPQASINGIEIVVSPFVLISSNIEDLFYEMLEEIQDLFQQTDELNQQTTLLNQSRSA